MDDAEEERLLTEIRDFILPQYLEEFKFENYLPS